MVDVAESPSKASTYQHAFDSSSMSQTRDNSPNVGKFFYSMRRMGYDNVAALGDIVDNSVDAGASEIRVLIQQIHGDIQLIVADNGDGMDYRTLDEAMKLGSDTSRDVMRDLGHYGMGLVTASISMGRRITVITREKGGPLLFSVQDLDEQAEANHFFKYIGQGNDEHFAQFRDLLGDSENGTVVIVSKCDQIQDPKTTHFASKVIARFARVYRMFLPPAGVQTIVVNGKKVQPNDPLFLEGIADGQTTLEYDQHLDVKYTDDQESELTEKVRIRIVKLPDLSQGSNDELKINQQNQGFCLMRNNREITYGTWAGLWGEKHPDLNRVRGEIFFPAVLDDLFGVDFTKQTPKFKQSLVDQLRNHVYPEISRLKNQNASDKRKKKDALVSHTEAEHLIAQRANLLPKTAIEIEMRDRQRKAEEPKSDSDELDKERQRDNAPTRTRTPKKTHVINRAPKIPCRFMTMSMTPYGPIYQTEMQNGTLTIFWNRDHVFYERFVLDNKDNAAMLVASDFLVYAWAKAEIGYKCVEDERLANALDEIHATISTVMRQLLT